MLAAVAGSVALLIAPLPACRAAYAQGAQFDQAAPATMLPAQDATGAAPPGPFLPGQTRQHYVPQHVTRDGQFVPGHFEAIKRPPFQGHYADKEAQRHGDALHGYHEPAPDYETPPGPERRMEGR